MAIPVAYWVASQCAVVLFLMFPRHGRQRDPMIMHATYSRTGAGWTRDPYSSGTFFDHDPIARPGDMRDLGGQPMTSGGSMHLREQPPPGYPAAVVTGRVDPAVTQIALIQGGHEDRRPLQSHYGAWGRLRRATGAVPGSRPGQRRNGAGHPGLLVPAPAP
jgi:hypothetical protein